MGLPDGEELKKLVEQLRALGVTSLETPDLRLQLGSKPAPEMTRPSLEEQDALRKRMEAYEEAMLYGSSEGFPEGWWTK